jgi:hypothetical protein
VAAKDVALHQAIIQLRAALRGLLGALAAGVTPAQEHLGVLNTLLANSYPA